MNAPDKIYVCIPQRLNLSTFKEDSKYVGMAYTDKGNLTSPQIEEYIRKDLLLEWLNNEVERYNDKLIQSSNNKEEAIQIASSISSLLRVIAKLETL